MSNDIPVVSIYRDSVETHEPFQSLQIRAVNCSNEEGVEWRSYDADIETDIRH